MESPIIRLRSAWRAAGLDLCPGLSREEIAAAEEYHSVAFPSDFREYLQSINGMPDRGWDREMIHFRLLENILPVATEYSGRRGHESFADIPELRPYFIFADYLISSHFYAIALDRNPEAEHPVIWLHENLIHPLAPSFTAFIELYLRDIASILFPADLR